MKSFDRFNLMGDKLGPDPEGRWVLFDDVLEALAERQAVLDSILWDRDRLQTCTEIADRMRAFFADHRNNEEAQVVSEIYDRARALSLSRKKPLNHK